LPTEEAKIRVRKSEVRSIREQERKTERRDETVRTKKEIKEGK
jgi:hypothetical protein